MATMTFLLVFAVLILLVAVIRYVSDDIKVSIDKAQKTAENTFVQKELMIQILNENLHKLHRQSKDIVEKINDLSTRITGEYAYTQSTIQLLNDKINDLSEGIEMVKVNISDDLVVSLYARFAETLPEAITKKRTLKSFSSALRKYLKDGLMFEGFKVYVDKDTIFFFNFQTHYSVALERLYEINKTNINKKDLK